MVLLVLGLQVVTLAAAVLLALTGYSRSRDIVAAYAAPGAVLGKPAAVPTVAPAVPAPPPALPSPIPPDMALNLRGVEITQGIQVFNEPELPRCAPQPDQANYIFCNNSMPLVAGRHTMLRVYLACNGPCPATDAVVQLHIFKAGQERASRQLTLPPAVLRAVSNLPLVNLRAHLANSVNFEFFPPPDWLTGDITFSLQAQADPARLPASHTITRNFAVRKPLRIAYLPIDYRGEQPANPQNAGYWLLRMYPVPGVEYYRLPAPDLVWDDTVSKSQMLRKLLLSYWFYAQSQPPDRRPDQLFGWLPQDIYNGGASDPFWCPTCAGPHSSRVAFGGLRPEQDIGGPRILVHEIAHNLGAQHAWTPTAAADSACFRDEGVDIRVDPTWPYPDTPHIQEFGLDLYSQPPVVYPPSNYDVMAYCTQPWISPYTYRKLFDSPFLQPQTPPADPLFAAFNPPAQPAITQTVLLVSGVIYPNGTASQPEMRQLDGDSLGSAAAFAPPADSLPPGRDYCLNVLAANGTTLAQRCFNAGFVDLETGQPTEPASYFFSLPNIDAAAVGRITLTKGQLQLAGFGPSPHRPQVEVRSVAGGPSPEQPVTITWAAADADGDRLTFDLFYANGGGQWLPLAVQLSESSYTFFPNQLAPGAELRLKVVASDGFYTATTEADGAAIITAK